MNKLWAFAPLAVRGLLPAHENSMSLQTPQYPGLDPNEDRGTQITVVGIVFMCVSFVVIALRFFSRVYTRIAISTDDWLIVVATVSLRISPAPRFQSLI